MDELDVYDMAKSMEYIANTMKIFHEATASAQSYRDELERSGWSPTMAEQMAGNALAMMVSKGFGLKVGDA